MQRPFCEKGVPDSTMRMDVKCIGCSKRDRECREYAQWAWAQGEVLSSDNSPSICAHCGQRPAGDHKDGAGERVCDLCAGVTQATAPKPSYEQLGAEIGAVVDKKQEAYGDSFGRAGQVLKVLYPDGISPEQYDDALAITRIVDKLFRVANHKDAFGESPYKDLAGYALLGAGRQQ